MASKTPASMLTNPADKQNGQISAQDLKVVEKPDAGLRSLDHCKSPPEYYFVTSLTEE